MRKISLMIFIPALLGYLLLGTSIACVCPGLNGWHYRGNVYTSGCDKVLGDDNADWSYLYKFDPEPRGQYRISFDFKNELSPTPYRPDSGDFAFLDTFYASLYFVNSCSRFDLENCSCDYSLPLFDLDSRGPFNSHGNISQSSRGEDWLHFDMVFTSYFYKIVPTFELFDMNTINGDSKVFISDLSISPVPIPASFFLLAGGLMGLLLLRSKRAKILPPASPNP